MTLVLGKPHPLEYISNSMRMPAGLSKSAILKFLNEEYPADPVLESDFVGKTNLEVAVIKQIARATAGSMDALGFLLDRVEGKPVQANVNANVAVTYQDFLDNVIDTNANAGAEEIS